MVAVPSNLKGKTVLDAHQWVISQIDGRNEYTLSGPTGQTATLSDITAGRVNEVNIVPQGARANPAPAYAFKPEAQPQKRIQQFSSRVLLPEGLSPSLVHALEAKHGSAYRFIASKMLSARSRRGHLTPKGQRMLQSFILADPAPVVRRNPIGIRDTPNGLRLARVIGDRGRVMDDKVIQEVRRYLNEGETPFNIGATEAQFDLFRTGVLQPYLISIEANMELIRYLNETLIPHMNRLIDNGAFESSAFEAQGLLRFTKAKAATGAGRAELKKALATRYDTVVRRLATSPKDFYMGRNEALIANPLFLYPQARFFMIPPPDKLTGGTRAELFLYQAGEPPRYGVADTPAGDANIIMQQLPTRIQKAALKAQDRNALQGIVFPIARVNNAPAVFGDVLRAENITQALRSGDVMSIITSASQAFYNTDALRRLVGLGAATPPGGLTSDESNALIDLNRVVNQINADQGVDTLRGVGQLNPETLGIAAAIEVNIGGIKPRPVNWPEGLIMSMMQVLGENVDQLINRGGPDFFSPQIGGLAVVGDRVALSSPPNLDRSIRNYSPGIQRQIRMFFARGLSLDDLSRANNNAGEVNTAYAAAVALHLSRNPDGSSAGKALPDNAVPNADTNDARKIALNSFKNMDKDATKGDLRTGKFYRMQTGAVRGAAPGAAPGQISILNIIQEAMTRFKQKGGSPTPEEVTFVTQLTYHCLANLDANVGDIGREGLGDILADIVNVFQEAENNDRQERIAGLIAQLDERRNNIPDENVLQQMVLDRVIERLFTDILAGRADNIDAALQGGAFGEVQFDADGNPILANPRRNPPVENLAAIVGDTKDLDAIRRARDALRQSNRASRAGMGEVEAFIPNDATITKLSQRLEGVFRQALIDTQEERAEAERLADRNLRIEARLGAMAEREALRAEADAYQQIVRRINDELTSLLNHEEEYVESYLRVPDDPFMELQNNVSREQMLSHPLYITQDLHGRHALFMRSISNTENALRTAVRTVQGQIARMGDDEEQLELGIVANEFLLDYFMDGIDFCNGMQEAYGAVGGYLNAAIEDMRLDEPDDISVNLYLALFDVADNFALRSGVRAGLRASAETASSPVDPTRNRRVFDRIVDKSFAIVSDLLGAFPGDVPSSPPNQAIQMASEYLLSLVNANLGFGGGRAEEMQRDELIIDTFGGQGRIERALERQRQAFYRQRTREEGLEKQLAQQTFDTSFMGRAAALFDPIEQQLASEEAIRREQSSLGRMGSAIDMIESLERQSLRDQSMADASRLMMFDQNAINDAVRRVGMMRFKEDLRRPGSQIREGIAASQYDLKLAAAPPASLELAAGITPSDREVMMAYGMNNRKLDTMALSGAITERMRDYAKSKNYHWTTVEAITEGARIGRERQAQIREVERALSAAGPEFQIDTPENIYNDLSTRIGMAEQQMFDATFMRNPSGVRWIE